jgi:D-3-phosphoglycerate dehydrogenase
MIDVLISEQISGPYVEALSSRFQVSIEPDLWQDQQALSRAVTATRTLIVRNKTQVTGELMRGAENLVAIGRAGVGLDNIDMQSANGAGIVVTSTPDQNAISVAELTIGLMISLAREIPQMALDTANGNWSRQRFVGVELYGKTLGIIGAGKIGYLTAMRARALGMNVLAYDPFVSEDNVFLGELHAKLVDLDQLLARADFVSVHVPASPKTTGLLNRERLDRMKPTAYLINTARGPVIVEDDLIEALKAGSIAGAALDVRVSEPPQDSPLNHMPNVILTPHIAAFTREAQDRVVRAVCTDIARLLEGKPARNAVTAFSLPRNGNGH